MKREPTSTTSGTGGIYCPFFKSHGKTELLCEGFADGISAHIMRFQNHGELLKHEKIFCEARFRCCEVFRILWSEKYEMPLKGGEKEDGISKRKE